MPVMVRRMKRPDAKKKNPSKAKDKSKSRGIEADIAENEFITPDCISSTRMDHASLLGVMPKESESLLQKVVFKVNHLCQWTPQLLALTADELCFTVEGDTNMRDKIPLAEVGTQREFPAESSMPPTPSPLLLTQFARIRLLGATGDGKEHRGR